MTHPDGERIAPVTWLFGTPPQPEVDPAPSPSGASSTDVAADDRTADEGSTEEASTDDGTTDEGTEQRRGHFERVSNVSMYALARRGMSSREMRDYLLGREFEPGAVDDEIERLEGVALLDDIALAETLVRTLRDRKGLGRSALSGELRRRQLDGGAIEQALAALDDDELERAIEIAAKRAPQLRSLDSDTAKRRLGAFLMRKGYSGSVVGTAVARALAPTGSGGPTFR